MNPPWTILGGLLTGSGLAVFPWGAHSNARLIVALTLWVASLASMACARKRFLEGHRKWPWHLPPEVVMSDMEKLRNITGGERRHPRRSD